MSDAYDSQLPDGDPTETQEWRQAIDEVAEQNGPARAQFLLAATMQHASRKGCGVSPVLKTPYINTIPPKQEPDYPGDAALERRIRAIMRWNAVCMVARANKKYSGIGGHISSYASSANLYEMGFNHFFRGPGDSGHDADQIFYQGHATPGLYARAFFERRLTEADLDSFRRQTKGGGLSSYPHPYLQPDFWQFPTVSMGLGPIHAIYQARFNRYLHNRGLKDTSNQRVWAFLGDGECDEPESLGALGLAAREGLNNLVFVINCNLQRLDGPVRGNGKIIDELESTFRGAGWDTFKVVWGPEWDPLIEADIDGMLTHRLGEVVDGQYQALTLADGPRLRAELFGPLASRVEHLSDEELKAMRRGGHSDAKLHAAYDAATKSNKPVCILAKTVKGWTLGDGFEASNVTHQMKKMDEAQLLRLRDRLELPLSDEQAGSASYYHPGEDSPEFCYVRERRKNLGGSLPARVRKASKDALPDDKVFAEFFAGGKAGVEASTTMGAVRLLRALLRDKEVGKLIVPIVPDEARTFGMDAFFREFGIYAAFGQRYKPVDSNLLLNYHEAQDGQLLEEGITEAGSMSSFMAASTAHATHGVSTIPFYMFYSMFGLQRTGDQAWAIGDARGRGFWLGATAGRTTLHGEGLQHNDGHSHLFALAYPHVRAYDLAYAYETAVVVQAGLKAMREHEKDACYYLTLYNENYEMPALPTQPQPKGALPVKEGIVAGLYRVAAAQEGKVPAQLFASGPMVKAALQAQEILRQDHGVAADVWSVTSYQQLYRQARATERSNRLQASKKPVVPYVAQAIERALGPIVTVSDWVTELPHLVSRYVPRTLVALGCDGFGRSDTREALRAHFEVDVPHIVCATLYALSKDGAVAGKAVQAAYKKYGIDADKSDPFGA